MENLSVPVSLGEIYDKYSILKIKESRSDRIGIMPKFGVLIIILKGNLGV